MARLSVRRLKEILIELDPADDAVIRIGSDHAERFDYLEEIGYDNDVSTLILYFEK